jgi:hypothetical protein
MSAVPTGTANPTQPNPTQNGSSSTKTSFPPHNIVAVLVFLPVCLFFYKYVTQLIESGRFVIRKTGSRERGRKMYQAQLTELEILRTFSTKGFYYVISECVFVNVSLEFRFTSPLVVKSEYLYLCITLSSQQTFIRK